ncbi:hypothetical protein [Pseudothauera rhizosphaerae]|uniref:Terminase-like family protein n=1 Tax=Pseudothauera rhizosphaerae TaxID=2565932 RepID=A0A4S4AAJ4_9RHOO|nr:hypothetical protein [Pseudothauera rhizosphaerae]THF55927.1 hypothetical protein E6O51_20285 [Pseudothauera rhizosphaerae]
MAVDPADYVALQRCAWGKNGSAVIDAWEWFEAKYGRAELGRADRFFLLVSALHRPDAFKPWLYERCREVEAEPDGCLDLWAREHYKSTIITFAGIVQEVVRDPEITVGIFSHTKGVSRTFLGQLKREFESNDDLKSTYPEVFYADPASESPRWSLDGGLIVKRKGNPKEATIEAHGLVDGQPTGRHFLLMVYDDVVTRESVTTPEQVKKTTDAWGLSDNLGARGADGRLRKWHIGTRYSFADTYQYILDRSILKPRIHPATDNGKIDGNPVFLSREAWAEKVKTQPSAILAAQMLQNPAAGQQAMFRKEWLRFLDMRPATLNVYILCDPASSKKKDSDRTAIAVIGIDAAKNRWLLDGYHHRMSLSERWQALRGLRKVWMAMPGVQRVEVGYERYGALSDLEYFDEQMRRDRDSFEIEELNWTREGNESKYDRIQRLEPYFRAGQFILPAVVKAETAGQRKVREAGQAFRIYEPTRRRDENGNIYSLSKTLLDEYLVYPFSAHDDFLDACSRIEDMDPQPPVIVDERALMPETFADGV